MVAVCIDQSECILHLNCTDYSSYCTESIKHMMADWRETWLAGGLIGQDSFGHK